VAWPCRYRGSRRESAVAQLFSLGQMDTSRQSQRLLTTSHVLFFIVLGVLAFLATKITRLGGSFPDIRPFAVLFLFAFTFQVFVVYHHRKNLLSWILFALYGFAALTFILGIISMVYNIHLL